MFGWFKSKEVYPERKRRIFKYHNGDRVIWADPLVLKKRLMEVAPALAIDIKVAESPSKDWYTAHGQMIQKICDIFKLHKADPFNMEKGGLSEDQIPAVLENFLAYEETQKKNMKTSATSLTPLAGSKTSSEENQPTKSSLVSGSTENESSIEEPESLPTEPLLLSDKK